LKEETFGYGDYLSPFTWRYGSPEMRSLFSEKERRATWRRVWLALAEAEADFGLVSPSELGAIRRSSGRRSVDITRAHELEKELRHDLMAELKTYAAQAGKGGGKLHLGATSMDIEDNADMLTFAEGTALVLRGIAKCLRAAKGQVLKHRRTVCMAWTHLQPAEPTTLGYRMANYAQDLVMDVDLIETVRAKFLLGKGVKGAVGTSASFKALLGSDEKVQALEGRVMKKLGIDSFGVSTQTYPRKVDFLVLSALASVAQSCYKFGVDLRIMQSPAFGELSEPMGKKQVGSSAMPFKRNPVTAERMCSLARLVSVLPMVALQNASNSLLERTLDDSASRRVIIPEAFLAVDECLAIYADLMEGMRVYPVMVARNVERYGPFSGTEAVMMKLVEEGEDRQEMHEMIREKSFKAWEEVMAGKDNPMAGLLFKDKRVSRRFSKVQLGKLLDPRSHVGDAPFRCEAFVKEKVDPILARYKTKAGRRDGY
jgi:adenylosuccinate lyase